MTDHRTALSYLHVRRTRAQAVLVHHAFGVEEGESSSDLHVRHHDRFIHPKPAVLSASAPTTGEHLQERLLVDGVVPFAQTFGAVLVGGSETIVRLAAQTHESITRPFHLEQTRSSLVERSSPLAALFISNPLSVGESTAHVLVSMSVATFRREPFGSMTKIMFS